MIRFSGSMLHIWEHRLPKVDSSVKPHGLHSSVYRPELNNWRSLLRQMLIERLSTAHQALLSICASMFSPIFFCLMHVCLTGGRTVSEVLTVSMICSIPAGHHHEKDHSEAKSLWTQKSSEPSALISRCLCASVSRRVLSSFGWLSQSFRQCADDPASQPSPSQSYCSHDD